MPSSMRLRRVTPAAPARGVVARENAVEIVLHERSDQSQRLFCSRLVRRADLAALEVLACEGGIPAKHDAPGLGQIHDKRLMTGGMPGRRYDLESGRDADPSGHRHVAELGDIPIHPREVRLVLRERDVLPLDDE